MNDDNKFIIIAAVVAMCFLMTLLLSCTRGCSSKKDNKVVVTQPKAVTTVKVEEEEKEYRRASSSYSAPGRSFNAYPPALLSEKDKAELAKRYKENREKLRKKKLENIEKQLNDPNLSPVAKEQIRLRTNPSFVKGMYALDKKDYKVAITSFNEIVKDEKTTPISKYFACSQLMETARRMKDIDLYFIAARIRAKLMADEDLSMLGISKGNDTLEWCNKVEYSLRAKNDPKYYEMCLKLKLANCKEPIPKLIMDKAKKEVDKEIKFYSKQYKELVE